MVLVREFYETFKEQIILTLYKLIQSIEMIKKKNHTNKSLVIITLKSTLFTTQNKATGQTQ